MTNTIQDIQDYINAEDWGKLVTTDWMKRFYFAGQGSEQLTLTPEFAYDFFLNPSYWRASKKLISNHFNAKPDNSKLFKLILQEVLAASGDYTVEDWKKFINSASNMTRVVKETVAIATALTIHGKPANFLRALIDDSVYSNAKAFIEQKKRSMTVYMKTDILKELSSDELKALKHKMNYNGHQIIKLFEENAKYILPMFDSNEEAIEYLQDFSKFTNADMGAVFHNIPKEDMEKIINDVIKSDKHYSTWRYMTYYKYNPEVEIPDDLIEKSFDAVRNVAMVASKIINVMTDEQIEKFADLIPAQNLFQRDGMTLDEVVRMKIQYRTGNHDLFGMRFFTEEEMQSHPHLFDPSNVKNLDNGYISKETLSKLNKAWGGKKYRHSDKNTDFFTIITKLPHEHVSMDVMKYLVKKTNASNELVCSVLKKYHFTYANEKAHPSADPLKKLNDLFKKYD